MKNRVFAVYVKIMSGATYIMKLVDLVLMPHYFTPVRAKYKIQERYSGDDICVTYH